MRLDSELSLQVLSGRYLGIKLAADGNVKDFAKPWGGSPYPPPGYVPWNILEVGNGDTYGFYWPIGKEELSPIVCTIMHDAWRLFPVASSFQRAIRLLHAAGLSEDQAPEVAEEFGICLTDIPETEADEKVPFWGKAARGLLFIDDSSPSVLLAAARSDRLGGDLVSAAAHAVRAVEILPEYADGWEMLALIRRQQQDHVGFVDAALRAIIAPFAFGASDRAKLLAAIQRLPDSACRLPGDPVWQRRKGFTFKQGVLESPDLRLMLESIAHYHQSGEHVRAIYLRILTGEWMNSQTVSFRERAKWSWPDFYAALRQDHMDAGLLARLPAL